MNWKAAKNQTMASTIKEIKNPWIRTLAEYGLITVSIWIMVIGIYFFKFPNHFAFGGVTGFSTSVQPAAPLLGKYLHHRC